ncbi:MAG: methyltransferase domain-containing protein [Burkholderiaceae bacterium]
MSGGIIGLAHWLETPAGRYLLDWEQSYLDQAVADLFGFHSLQLGLNQIDALRANRMPHRWIATESTGVNPDAARVLAAVSLHCSFDALPFDSQSLDLVVLPHTLEVTNDPHLALREVERVLVPEGRVVIVGFNPASLWGLRQRLGGLRRRLLPRTHGPLFMPSEGEFFGYRRLRDWLRLLSFEVEAGRFGCYLPPLVSQQWLSRFAWMERVGERWWPVFGAVYCVVAVKRVRGMRLVGLARTMRRMGQAAPAVAVNHRGFEAETLTRTGSYPARSPSE